MWTDLLQKEKPWWALGVVGIYFKGPGKQASEMIIFILFFLFFLVWHILRASEWNWCLFTFFIVLGRFSLFRKMLWSAYQNKKLAANWRRWLVQSAAGRQKYWQSFRALAVSEWRVDRASFCLWVEQLTQTYLSKGPVIPSTFAKTVLWESVTAEEAKSQFWCAADPHFVVVLFESKERQWQGFFASSLPCIHVALLSLVPQNACVLLEILFVKQNWNIAGGHYWGGLTFSIQMGSMLVASNFTSIFLLSFFLTRGK